MSSRSNFYEFEILSKTFGIDFKNVKNRLELDYPQLYEPNKLIPVEGKAGTLIVFDSDIFHQGGKINIKDKERIVKGMKKGSADFKKRYGDNWKAVMYATATKIAKKKA